MSTYEVVSYKDLKSLLPEKVLGAKVTNIEGETSGIRGFATSEVKATYEKNGVRVDISIMDASGSVAPPAGIEMWLHSEFEREWEDGYERTTEIDGNKSYEQYGKSTRWGKLSVLVNNRFVVDIEGSNISEKDLRQILNNINLRKLRNLK